MCRWEREKGLEESQWAARAGGHISQDGPVSHGNGGFLIKNLALACPAFTALNQPQNHVRYLAWFATPLCKIQNWNRKQKKSITTPSVRQDSRDKKKPLRVTQLTCVSKTKKAAFRGKGLRGRRSFQCPRVYEKVVTRSGHTVIRYRSQLDRRVLESSWTRGAERDCRKENKQIRGRVAQKVRRREGAFCRHPSLPHSLGLNERKKMCLKARSSGIWISTESLPGPVPFHFLYGNKVFFKFFSFIAFPNSSIVCS